MRFIGEDNIITRVIWGYSPCINKEKDFGTVYQQDCHHLINKLKDDTCLCKCFCEDLLHHMKKWRKDGKCLILCINTNKKKLWGDKVAINGPGWSRYEGGGRWIHRKAAWNDVFSRKWTDWWHLGHWQSDSGKCLCRFGLGDHWLFVIDFVTATLVGSCSQSIVSPALRRSNTKIKGCAYWYNKMLQKNLLCHRLLEWMVAVASSAESKEVVSKNWIRLTRRVRLYEACRKEMPEAQVGLHPVLSGSVALDSSVPSILDTLAVACQEDTELGESKIDDAPVSDQCPVSALCWWYQVASEDMQQKVQLFLKAWKTPQATASG